MRRLLVAMLVLVPVAGACSGDDGHDTAPATVQVTGAEVVLEQRVAALEAEVARLHGCAEAMLGRPSLRTPAWCR